MKQLFYFILLFGVFGIFGVSCSDDDDNNPGGGGNTSGIVLSTIAITNISSSGATSGGDITSDGGSPIIAHGVCWGTSSNPTTSNNFTSDGSGLGTYSSSITGLSNGVTYYVRAYAINANGTAYGSQLSFVAIGGGSGTGIVLSTTAITNISSSGATSGGDITSDGGSAIVDRGVCWSNSPNPTIADDHTNDGSSVGVFVSTLNGLSAGTTYYLRAYATNANTTAYGNQVSFTTSNSGGTGGCVGGPSTVTDVDGNVYNVVSIGNQCWMKENLKTAKYRNGDPITTNLSDTSWSATTSGAYAIYNNTTANDSIYGKFYNGYAMADPRELCPVGWHVPSDTEWATLVNFLGGDSVAGGKMKAVSPLWLSPNVATNSSGFSGLPAGYRSETGFFYELSYSASFWSSTQGSTARSSARVLFYNNNDVFVGGANFISGGSVRCVRD